MSQFDIFRIVAILYVTTHVSHRFFYNYWRNLERSWPGTEAGVLFGPVDGVPLGAVDQEPDRNYCAIIINIISYCNFVALANYCSVINYQ